MLGLLLSPPPPSLTFYGRVEEKVCRDCGNRAKKECLFERCRTCCKTRGYDCPTHVKSTWIPASHRLDRTANGSSSSERKRLRIDVSHKNNFSNFSLVGKETTFKEGLPGRVEAPAVFRRTRVTAITNEQAEIGYQATVTIGGHVFKGFLHYYGVDHNKAFPCISKN